MKNSNLATAMMILSGKTVAAPDRKKETAPAIPFIKFNDGKETVIVPEYGVSDKMRSALSKLASRVTFEPKPGKAKKTKKTMPHYRFAA